MPYNSSAMPQMGQRHRTRKMPPKKLATPFHFYSSYGTESTNLRVLEGVEKRETSHKTKDERQSSKRDTHPKCTCPRNRIFPIASSTGSNRRTTPSTKTMVPAASRMIPILRLSENRLSIPGIISWRNGAQKENGRFIHAIRAKSSIEA